MIIIPLNIQLATFGKHPNPFRKFVPCSFIQLTKPLVFAQAALATGPILAAASGKKLVIINHKATAIKIKGNITIIVFLIDLRILLNQCSCFS